MIDFGKILKRAWHILWNYKVLWIFGLLLAITAGGGSGSSPQASYQFGDQDWRNFQQQHPEFRQFSEEIERWFEINVNPLFAPDRWVSTAIWIGVALLAFTLMVSLLTALIRYPSETAIIRMVDEYEQSGTKVGFKAGWKLGWSRRAVRLWLIDLIVNLPVLLFLLVMGGLGLAIYFSIKSDIEAVAVGGIVTAIGCLFLFILLFSLGMIFLGLLREFFWRAAALEETGVRDSFRRGWETFKRNWQSAALMGLITLGLGVGYAIASILLFFLFLLVMPLTIVIGLIVGGIPGALFGWLVSLFAPVWVAVLVGAVIFLPLFGLIAFSPFLLISGWIKVYMSSVWTLTYREMKMLESLQPGAETSAELPEPAA